MLPTLSVRVLFFVTSVCGLALAGCSASVVPMPTTSSSPRPTSTLPIYATIAPRSVAASPEGGTVRYVALGDSYTIGTAVNPRERWPNQLKRALSPGIDLDLIANLGVNGATTEDLIHDQLHQLNGLDPEFMTLLIGVNDVVQNVDLESYRSNLRTILGDLTSRVAKNRILLVTFPDYTLTPHGADYGDPRRQSGRVHSFNVAMQQTATELDLTSVDISPVSDEVAENASLVAEDGLHPSGKQYGGWVELIAPSVRQLLSSPASTP